MIKVALVRGKYLNNFEGQNYIFNDKKIKLTAFSSLYPIHNQFPFPVVRLPSLGDLGSLAPLRSSSSEGLGGLGRLGKLGEKTIKFLGNRIIGDSQILFGLEKYANDFDIFHTADSHYYYSYQLAKLRAQGRIKKLIVTSWETIPFNNESIHRKKFIKRFCLKHADYFICHTEKAKRALIIEGINEGKIEVVRLGINLNQFKRSTCLAGRRALNVKQDLFTILFVGRLVYEKGTMDLYEAYKKVKSSKLKVSHFAKASRDKQNYNLKLKIVGDGYLKNKLNYLIQKDNLNNNVTVEKRDYEEMPKVYQEADIFVLPSKKTKTWEEQYGMVLVEAMASGLPIVAYNSGTIPEIIGNAGIIVREGDVHKLSQSIFKLVIDRNLRFKLGKIGRIRAEEMFDSKQTAMKLKNIYRTLLVSQM